jgi:hypothetical protein
MMTPAELRHKRSLALAATCGVLNQVIIALDCIHERTKHLPGPTLGATGVDAIRENYLRPLQNLLREIHAAEVTEEEP